MKKTSELLVEMWDEYEGCASEAGVLLDAARELDEKDKQIAKLKADNQDLKRKAKYWLKQGVNCSKKHK